MVSLAVVEPSPASPASPAIRSRTYDPVPLPACPGKLFTPATNAVGTLCPCPVGVCSRRRGAGAGDPER